MAMSTLRTSGLRFEEAQRKYQLRCLLRIPHRVSYIKKTPPPNRGGEAIPKTDLKS